MDDGRHTSQAAGVSAWVSRTPNMPPVAEEEMGADVDEPPEYKSGQPGPGSPMFQKTTVRKPGEGNSSLLTKALLNQDEDAAPDNRHINFSAERRRSMTSNVSLASTADLTSDTGLTSPSRANTPSPPPPEMRTLCIQEPLNKGPKLRFGQLPLRPVEETVECAPRKKSITFACFAKPEQKLPDSKSSQPQQPRPTRTANANAETPRKSCIKFACPAPRSNAPAQSSSKKPGSPAARRHRSPAPPISRQSSSDSQKPMEIGALNHQASTQRNAHDTSYDEPTEDDWIREEHLSPKRRITINDTLVKENHIRQLAQEAEDEDAEDDDGNVDENDGEDDDDEEDGEDDEEDEEDEEDGDDDDSDEDDGDEDETECGSFEADDGYHTDEETGFAESDEDEEDGLHLWNHGIQLSVEPSPGVQGLQRRPSATGHHSDSSTASGRAAKTIRRRKPRPIPYDAASELPDSTDFVCGTFDEDRPMEEAYLTRRAARKAQKVQLIPQDIDPSFPTSDIEDGDGEELFNPVHHDSEDELWKMDDVHGDRGRASRKKSKGASPRRYRSPPPKTRARSPKGHKAAFEKHSPRRLRSPCPKRLAAAGVSPTNGAHAKFTGLGVRGGFPQTKSLPRPTAMLGLIRYGKKAKVPTSDQHVRGAIDIVKGLEHKRQRRREKYHHKYCNRARKGQIPERKAMPGQGATKMRELGLLMAGKTDRGNYVLSI